MSHIKGNSRVHTYRSSLLVALLIATGMAPAWAQHSHEDHGSSRDAAGAPATPKAESSPSAAMEGMDHGGMQSMGGEDMQTMDGDQIQTMEEGATPPTSMDHGDMNMQGGKAPPDARDPDAYSGGYQLGAGQYALGPHRQLHMADEHTFASILVDRLEWSHGSDSNAASYEAQAWFGSTYNKFVIKAEGEAEKGKVHDARTELLWGHAIATYWDTQLGVRNDSGYGRPARNWLAFGVQGLAPYWFEVDATGYVGTEGRTALRLSAEYELLITQRLILQPRIEANVYGKNDPATGVGSGLSNGAVGLRLRYEFSRQFAPYIGVERYQTFGNTADMVRSSGGRSGETRFVAGVRVWF
ncbi:copper resistance protein B [Cupriavidus sp. U2]|uniref:copper resistance protein B n=1 Tax=Cupriavidus sp. U2 TaxID=2920269 RepID=UPI001E447C1B|nr:copper resistance protein B [Cupriavidus sp. U2]